MVIRVVVTDAKESMSPETIGNILAEAIERITGRPCQVNTIARDNEYGLDISKVVR